METQRALDIAIRTLRENQKVVQAIITVRNNGAEAAGRPLTEKQRADVDRLYSELADLRDAISALETLKFASRT